MSRRGARRRNSKYGSVSFARAAERRRFYLERGLRKRPVATGTSLLRLMTLAREEIAVRPNDLFGDVPAVVDGGVAARAYAPERHTKDVDFLVAHSEYRRASESLIARGWQKLEDLTFPNSSLGLYGAAYEKGDLSIDVVASDQPWAEEALGVEAFDQTGLRVIALPYLVLMKIDSARGIDQGDLTRMLGRVDDDELKRIVTIVDRHSHDPQAADDVRQYAVLGKLEWGKSP